MITAAERDRLAHWGRLVTRTEGPPGLSEAVDTTGIAATGRRVSFLALSAAVVLPFVLPAFAPSILDGGRTPGKGTGDGSGGTLSFNDPMVSLAQSLQRSDPVDVLVVTSDDRPEYLRLAVLYEPGPDAWRTQPVDLADTVRLDQGLPPPVGMSAGVGGENRSMRISPTSNFPSDSVWLPVPFASQFVGAGDDWTFVSEDQTVTGLVESAELPADGYDVDYRTFEPTTEQLSSADSAPRDIAEHFAAVPEDVPAGIGATARAIVSGADSDYEAAVLLQDFFRDEENFEYDLDVGYGYGYGAMVDFLEERRGFCQQFAATMAMMARELGIPSRIAVGFLKPERLDEEGDNVFTSDNAHSWPELYFEGAGWVRFEPTPGNGASLPPYAPRPEANAPTGPSVSTPTSAVLTEDLRPSLNPNDDTASVAPDAGSSSSGSGGPLPSKRWLIVLAGIGVVALPGLLRRAVRRRRMGQHLDGATAAEAAWLELRDSMIDLRLPWGSSMTPRARGQVIGGFLGDDTTGQQAVQRLTLQVERARYANSWPTNVAPAQDLKAVLAGLAQSANRSQRLRALLLPASLVSDLRVGLAQLRDKWVLRRAPSA